MLLAARRAPVAVILASVGLLGGCAGLMRSLTYTEGRAAALSAALSRAGNDPVARGVARFAYDDLGGLSTDALESNAVPWKIVVASLVMARADREHRSVDRQLLHGLFTEYGFLVPDSIENWAGPPPLRREWRPLGINTGPITRSVPRIELELGNLGCASCHAGVTYDRHGTPTGRAWLGAPNTSLDLQSYSGAVFSALKEAMRNEARLLAAIDTLFPDVSAVERRTIRKTILPRIRTRLPELDVTLGGPVPFNNGGPGLTNGAAAMKYQLGLIPRDRPAHEYAFTSIPDLASRTLRSSLLYDGTYVAGSSARFREMTAADVSARHVNDISRIVALFTVPVMGVRLERAREAYPNVQEMMGFLSVYRPPPFPGPVDTTLARAGARVYSANCASCHGTMSDGLRDVRVVRFPNRLVPQAEMGTDSVRWTTITPATVQALRKSAYGDLVNAERTGGYVAPILTGLWISAPYLHNGSVPTLWDLMHPDSRPERFLVGGHRLDLQRIGVALGADSAGIRRYAEGYTPWSSPQVFDTRQPGRSNRGHDREFTSLPESDRAALIEYLKVF